MRFVFVSLFILATTAACGDDDSSTDSGTADAGRSDAESTDVGGGTDGALTDTGGEGISCGDFVLVPLDDDPDEGYIDITEFCLAEINMYRAREGLEPYTIKEDGRCCSAQEAHQALLDGTAHNGDYCDWQAQGSAGGGRNPSGTARASVEWVPRLFWRERGDTFEESGGHYQAMMRPGTREIACGWYASDRDNHKVMVNYW